MKILTIIGARPQFVKAAVLSRIIAKDDSVTELLVHTGQHYDSNMSDVFFEEMQIPKPNYQLKIKSKYHGEMTALMMIEIEKIAMEEKPDWIMVYGDTNSTLAGALVASKLHIKLAHVEAGLRSFNNLMPEEINRIVTDRLSDILFCPTDSAVKNLQMEGYQNLRDKKIVKTGDVMLDASMFYADKVKKGVDGVTEGFVLCTIHRPVNTDDQQHLSIILSGLNEIGKEKKVFFPVHPRTRGKIEEMDSEYVTTYPNIIFADPISYFEMIWCLQNCSFVITDSGGLQKEAYFFKKMCLTLRDETEWVELVEYGYNFLSSINQEEIIEKAGKITETNKGFDEFLYGDGHTGQFILDNLKNYS
ncbi:UDP-N-acetylglucosamine 2-epimerase (non-hydrolyzing) [Pedobacter sp. HDW13]|uniref:non-hydrolyzing UDP-N-acetylglucosamine 2-epimerase n=1 Tax=Pedobacter sp. HDW13 TaxID=2714940 RepID=UPI00140E5FED|nr:UDP-N-acetylglucosamine 2-epimerase (non-hydrolyzing) [Pedobacter sp. HDW13]QIL39213.1 UDP-N-acetylglucosamine 2-epimerase (non-hydrolyzing) [Pedobacter sp. HDW13]